MPVNNVVSAWNFIYRTELNIFLTIFCHGMLNWMNFISISQHCSVWLILSLLFVIVCCSLIVCVCYYYRSLNMREVEHKPNENPSQQACTWFSCRHNSFGHSHRSHVVILFLSTLFLFILHLYSCWTILVLFSLWIYTFSHSFCSDFGVIDVFYVCEKKGFFFKCEFGFKA